MEQAIGFIITALIIICTPYILWFFLIGFFKCKNLVRKNSEQTGIKEVVKRWENLNPTQRMEADALDTIDRAQGPGKTQWVESPTPEDEIRMKNERVYREGLLQKVPQTEITDEK